MKVILSKKAGRFLRQERAYLEQFNPRAAMAVMRQLRASLRLLGEFPRAGGDLQALEGRRRLVSGAYIIHYRVEKSAVYVSHIRHGRQEPLELEKDGEPGEEG